MNQEWQDWELIVIDDGSTDGGAAIVESIADPRIRLVRQDNAGVSAARNRGIREASADWIAFLDADDEWKPEFLSVIQRLRSMFPDCQVCATNYDAPFADGTSQTRTTKGMPPVGSEVRFSDVLAATAHGSNPLMASAIAASACALGSVGGFPESMRSGEDQLTWIALTTRFPVAYANSSLATYHLGDRHLRDGPGRKRAVDAGAISSAGQYLGQLLAETEDTARSLASVVGRWHLETSMALLDPSVPNRSLARAEAVHGIRAGGFRQPFLFVALAASYLPARLLGLLGRLRKLRRRYRDLWRGSVA